MLDYARKTGVRTLVITSRFTLYWSGARFNNREGGVESGKGAYIDLLENRDENAGPLDQDRRDRVLQSYTDNISFPPLIHWSARSCFGSNHMNYCVTPSSNNAVPI